MVKVVGCYLPFYFELLSLLKKTIFGGKKKLQNLPYFEKKKSHVAIFRQ
jgi:hypothetical protein